ncbi:hypothetical protein [Alkalimonas sp.]|uniref:hypothetical protein n=1 Tax=Alkalimonas sp. TaxID=1872453 RepID=UPI00263B958F|nr:hypothetical protein [Alkalimonas sp.]MCC5824621.1 hypothetical protein [Alkalimonas sp.]
MTSQQIKKYTVEETHTALRNAVKKALERKKKLGHYSVMWQADRLIIEGQDAPEPTNPEP